MTELGGSSRRLEAKGSYGAVVGVVVAVAVVGIGVVVKDVTEAMGPAAAAGVVESVAVGAVDGAPGTIGPLEGECCGLFHSTSLLFPTSAGVV